MMPPNIIWKIWNSGSHYDYDDDDEYRSHDSFTEWTPERIRFRAELEEEARKNREREEEEFVRDLIYGFLFGLIFLGGGTGLGLFVLWYFGCL